MALIPITGYPSSWRAPFSAAEILFNQGPSTAAAGPRDAIYVGPITATGTWTAGTIYRISLESDAVSGAGAGSPLHRMIRHHLKVNPGGTGGGGKLYALPYAATSGGAPVAAAGTVTFATTPTASGLATVTVCGELNSYSYTTSDTVTTIAAAIRDQINAKTWLPVTATAAAGVVTLTAKVAGASQGDGTVGVIRYRATTKAGTGTTVTTSGAALGLGSGTAGVDGSTTENTNLTNALANIVARRFHYMGFSVWSATHLATIGSHVSTKSQPNPGLRSSAFTGYTHTLSAAQTLAIARNFERQSIFWQKNSEHDTAEISAQFVALHQKYETDEKDYVFGEADSYRKSDFLLLPAYAEADWPTGQDINDAVTDGISPVGSDQIGAYLAMSVNTRSKDSGGTLDDFRSTERHRVSVMDGAVDTILQRHGVTFQGFRLKDDERLSDGTVNANQKLGPRTLTPSRLRAWVQGQIREFLSREMWQGNEWNDSLAVNIDPNNVSRLEVGLSGRTIDINHQTTFRLSESSPG